MYCNFLGLRCLPFEDRIDTRFLYLSSTCNRLLTSLEHDAHHEHGVTPVFGEAGFGKTLLIRALVARLHASDHVAVVTCPRSGAVDLLPEVGKGFGVTTSPSEGRAQYTRRLRGQLVRNAEADHRSIVIVDQVEELTEENLGAVSSLVELRDSTGPLLSVMLFARPHARNTMNEPRFATLVQQYTHVRTIAPLNVTETQAYIKHRLAIAGSADPRMFEEGAVILIHAAAKGNPRLINQLCHASLLTTYRAEARGVSKEMASSVTTEFMQERHFTPTGLSADETNSESATHGPPAPEPSPARQAAGRFVQSPFFLTETTESIPSLSSPDYKISGESHGLAEPQASALTTELSVMIGRGEGLMHRLELLLTRVDAAGSAGSHDDGLAQDAEERLVELLEKTQRTCDRADRTESRLSRFADELGDQAEILQKRIGQLMDNLQVGETLQDEIRQTIHQATAKAASTNKEIETQKQALDKAISDAGKRERGMATQAWNDCQSRISESLEETQRVHHEMVQQTRRELQVVAKELVGTSRDAQAQAASIEKRFVAMTQETDDRIKRWRDEQAQAEANLNAQLASLENTKNELELYGVLARTNTELDDLIDRANRTKTDLTDTQTRGENLLLDTHAATGQIESMNHNVSQTLVDIGSACERVGQAREKLQGAEQVTARLAAIVDSGESIESKLDETTGKAADLRDAFIRTSAEVETKLGQLGSHSAAAAHVLSRLSEANIEAHGVMEQTAKMVKEAGEMANGTEHAVELTKRLGKVIRVANELTGEMTSRTDEAKLSAETLDGHCTQANILIDRVGHSVHLLDGARQVQTDLVESIDQARAIDAELRSAADDAVLKKAQLETTRQSASELIEAHEQVSAQTGDLIAQLNQGVADAHSTTDASQQLLDQFTRHGKTLHDVLNALGRRATKLEESLNEMTEKPSSIVAEARAQAAQLDQVCTAVGKVFAKLSKASLEAHEQTKDFHQASETAFERLEQLRRETDGTSRSLQTWVKQTLRVGSDLAQSLGSTHTNFQASPAYEQAVSSSQSAQDVRLANRRATGADLPENGVAESDRPLGRTGGDILKTAEAPRSIENPAALSMAHKQSREREIAGIIADAKAADSAKT